MITRYDQEPTGDLWEDPFGNPRYTEIWKGRRIDMVFRMEPLDDWERCFDIVGYHLVASRRQFGVHTERRLNFLRGALKLGRVAQWYVARGWRTGPLPGWQKEGDK